MGRVSPAKRKSQISQKRKRREKLTKLRRKYLAARSMLEKEKILEKAHHLVPWLSEKEFLNPLKEKSEN